MKRNKSFNLVLKKYGKQSLKTCGDPAGSFLGRWRLTFVLHDAPAIYAVALNALCEEKGRSSGGPVFQTIKARGGWSHIFSDSDLVPEF